MSRINVQAVTGGTYKAFEDGVYFGEATFDGWVDILTREATWASKADSAYGWHTLNVVQTVVAMIEGMTRFGKKSLSWNLVHYFSEASGKNSVVRPDAVCMGPPEEVGPHEGKTVEASDGEVYIVGRYVPVTGPKTAYYELTGKFDNWESHIKAQTLDGHLAAENWKELDD